MMCSRHHCWRHFHDKNAHIHLGRNCVNGHWCPLHLFIHKLEEIDGIFHLLRWCGTCRSACCRFACFCFHTPHFHMNYLLILSRGMVSSNHVVYEMQLKDVQALHQVIDEDWDDWVVQGVKSDIQGWNNSRFLLDNVPITIAVWYRQNQTICHGNDRYLEQEATHWHCIHNYRHMCQITFILAMHVQ